MPRIFSDNGFEVTVTDPSYANYGWTPDLSIYKNYPAVKAQNVVGRFTSSWISSGRNAENVTLSEKAIAPLFGRFSLLVCAPTAFRNFIFDHGSWLQTQDGLIPYGVEFFDNYVTLDVLPDITGVTDRNVNTFTLMVNKMTHDDGFLQAPDFVPSQNVTDRGTSRFRNESLYHTNIAAMLRLGAWFDFLKANGVYDNTRIIIVSDHGTNVVRLFPEMTRSFPARHTLESFIPFLMVKDFDGVDEFAVDDTFMTCADVPLFALERLVENPVNPWSGNVLSADKADGVMITASYAWQRAPTKTMFDIKSDEWLHVHTNIYDPANWSAVK
jgi:hypothetical protein